MDGTTSQIRHGKNERATNQIEEGGDLGVDPHLLRRVGILSF